MRDIGLFSMGCGLGLLMSNPDSFEKIYGIFISVGGLLLYIVTEKYLTRRKMNEIYKG